MRRLFSKRELTFQLTVLGLGGMALTCVTLLALSVFFTLNGARIGAQDQLQRSAAAARALVTQSGLVYDPQSLLGPIGQITDDAVALYRGNLAVAVRGFDPAVAGTVMPRDAASQVLDGGEPFDSLSKVGHDSYYLRYEPVFDAEHQVTGAVMVGMPLSVGRAPAIESAETMLAASFAIILLLGAVYVKLVGRITQAMDARQREIDLVNNQFRVAIANLSQGVVLFDAVGKLVTCNARYGEILGVPAGTILPGMTLRDTFIVGTDPDVDVEQIDRFVANRLAAIQSGHGERVTVHGRNNHPIIVTEIPIASGGWLALLDDVADRQQVQAEMLYLKHFDQATGLPNRDHVHDTLNATLERALQARADTAQWPAIINIHLPRLHAMENSFDTETIRRLVEELKARLQSCLRDGDVLGRLRPDTFVILPDPATTRPDVCRLAGWALGQVNGRYELNRATLSVQANAGVAFAPDHGTDATALMRAASLASEVTPAQSGNWRVFEPAMEDTIAARLVLEADLVGALSGGQFELYYQPLIDLQTNQIVCCEALLRWHHPTRGLLLPTIFIPLAEENGLIVRLGAWVLDQALRDAAWWPPHISVAVNLSAHQIRSAELVRIVARALERSGIDPGRLELEVTETVLLEGDQGPVRVLHALREMGVRISMDDFGTGHASLSYLRDFPFDKIKIDKSFVQEIMHREDCLAIIRAVTGLAGSLHMSVAAEGAENAEQVQRLREEGCDEVQGYFYSRPRPVKEIAGLFERDFGRIA